MDKGLSRFEASNHWLLSVLLNLVMPISPLVVELAISKEISVSSAVLSASMYSISTGLVCRSAPVLILSLIIAIFYIAVFGAVTYQNANQIDSRLGSFYALWVIGFLFLTNVVLKFWYHVIDRRPYTDFWLRND